MKRAAIVILALGVSTWSFAQGNKPASGQSAQPAAGQTAAAPQGKRPPQAKTQPEFDAYKAAAALTDPAAQEKAADDFAAKFPDSELRVVLYKSVMTEYQQANNGEKMLDMAHKVLGLDPDDPVALLGAAQALVEQTHDADIDKDQKLAEARKDADHALTTIDTDLAVAGQPQDKVDAYKNFLRSEAYEVDGTLEFNNKDWKNAETDLKKSIDVFPQQPDPIAIYRVAVALDMQERFPEAMKYCDQAVQLTKEGTPAGNAARAEKDRLTKLGGTSAPAQNAPAGQTSPK
jgi:tetratricopeptide (TPR) repeat protein